MSQVCKPKFRVLKSFFYSKRCSLKLKTLPAGALEEESTAFDDGGEEFCVVMSKRGRKEQKAAQLSKQNAIELIPTGTNNDQPTKSLSIDNDEQQNK